MPQVKRWVPPVLALFLLSPMVGELLSGSAPPAEFFTPFGFTVMTLLYGGGALTARELKVRWGKGMGSLLLRRKLWKEADVQASSSFSTQRLDD